MTTWRSKSLGDGLLGPTQFVEIERLFRPMFEAAGEPTEMAVFTRHEEGSLHCQVVAYFSPAAEAVARLVDALPCERPAHAGLQLLAGTEACWPMLFP